MKSKPTQAFTLIELLVVIAIIGILAGLLFPTLGAVRESARKTQAANDEQQIVTAVKSYYTEYGKYPVPTGSAPVDVVYSAPANSTYKNEQIITILRGLAHDNTGAATGSDYPLNPRQIVFLEVKDARDKNDPKGGIIPKGGTDEGRYVDPWGTPYVIFVDANYDNQITTGDVYTEDAKTPAPRVGVGVASLGKDKVPGKAMSKTTGDKKYIGSDDVVSWR